jgi:hypothetical protein
MPTTHGRKRKGSRPAGRKAQARPADRLREGWDATLRRLAAAEQDLEKQVRALLMRKGIDVKDASRALAGWRARAGRERRKALAALEGRMKPLQARLRKERKSAGRAVQGGVQSALAALNIPSRDEIAQLTRKVEALSRKLDARKR